MPGILIFVYILVVLSPLGVASAFTPFSDKGFVHELGKGMALMGAFLLFLQPVLAARFKWIERHYGLDMVLRFHRNMAILALGFLLVHPILIAASGMGFYLLYGLDLPWNVWLGKIAVVLLAINVVISLFRGRLGVSFEAWRLGHGAIAPLVLVLLFTHAWFTGGDFRHNDPLRLFWALMLLMAVAVYGYHRFTRPAMLTRHPYTVVDVRREARDVWTVKLEPPESVSRFDYLPGQFQFLTLQRAEGPPPEEHHWTISSSPTQEGYVTSTIKALGDFTSTIGRTRPGDTAVVHAPFGRFSYALHPDETKLAFIAGGIGVTPLMSMLRHMRDTRADLSVTFLYANESEEDIVFREELEKIARGAHPRLKLVHFLTRPGDGWSGETGRIGRDAIRRHCGDDPDQVFYLCGPPAMVEESLGHLREMGVKSRRIRLEVFAFL